MTHVVHSTLHSMLSLTRLTAGATATTDKGHLNFVEAYPEKDAGGTPPGHAFSTIGINWSGDGLDPLIEANPYVGKANNWGYRLASNQWVGDGTSYDTYTMSFEFLINAEYLQFNDRRIAECRDGSTMRWGIGIRPKQSIFDPDYQANLVTLLNESGSIVAGGTTPLYPNNWYKFEIQAKPGTTKLTVRIYYLVSNVWTIWTTLTANPTNMSADRMIFGSFAFESGNFNGGGMGLRMRNVDMWINTSTADGKTANNYQEPIWPSCTFSVIKNGVDTPCPEPKRIVSNAEVSATRAWNYPNGLRRSFENYCSYTGNVGNTQYSTSSDNCRLFVYRPTTTPPAGGFPCVMWVTTNYYVSGTYGSVLENHSQAMSQILAAGWAVAGVGVRLCALGAAGAKFPDPIIDAKLAARYLQANSAAHGINPNKIVAGGHSSGGSIAMSAMLSRDLTDNGYGKNMTLIGQGLSGPDPIFIGSLVWSPPVDFSTTYTRDPTHPGQGNLNLVPYQKAVGDVRAAINLFAGYAEDYPTPVLSGMNPAEWIDLSPHSPTPMLFFTSTGDTVVPNWNEQAMHDAYDLGGFSSLYQSFSQGNTPHDLMTALGEFSTMKRWLYDLIH